MSQPERSTAAGPPAPAQVSVVPLLASLFCSAMANVALDTVLGIEVFAISGRPLDLGLLGLAAFAPAAFLVLVTGSVADHFDRRYVAAVSSVAEALAIVGILAYVSTNPTAVGPIFALTALHGAARAFGNPAARALPADVVSAARVPWVVARSSVTWQTAIIVGPVMGGFLYAANPLWPYPVMIALTLLAAILMLFVRRSTERAPVGIDTPCVEDEERTPIARAHLSEAVEGLRFVRSQPILLGAISLDLFAVLFGGAVALLPAIAADRLHVGPAGIGWLRAAGGIGAAAVTLCLAVRPLRHRVGVFLFGAVAIFGVATIALGVTHLFAVAFVAMLVLSGADAISVFIRATLVPLVTPESKRGRVLAVEAVFIGASNELGAFESGVAGQLLGASGAVVLGGVATLAVAIIWTALFPSLRGVDEFPTSPD